MLCFAFAFVVCNSFIYFFVHLFFQQVQSSAWCVSLLLLLLILFTLYCNWFLCFIAIGRDDSIQYIVILLTWVMAINIDMVCGDIINSNSISHAIELLVWFGIGICMCLHIINDSFIFMVSFPVQFDCVKWMLTLLFIILEFDCVAFTLFNNNTVDVSAIVLIQRLSCKSFQVGASFVTGFVHKFRASALSIFYDGACLFHKFSGDNNEQCYKHHNSTQC